TVTPKPIEHISQSLVTSTPALLSWVGADVRRLTLDVLRQGSPGRWSLVTSTPTCLPSVGVDVRRLHPTVTPKPIEHISQSLVTSTPTGNVHARLHCGPLAFVG